MQNNVTIKGKEKGLEIVLSERSTYPVLRQELLEKLQSNKHFFEGSETKVIIRGKSLSQAQRKEIKRVFSMDYGIEDVLYGDEADLLKDVEIDIERAGNTRIRRQRRAPGPVAARVQKEQPVGEDNPSRFINQTVRSGQRIEAEGDIVVIGDVNPGAEVIAGGSIAVFGKLRGLAHAGCMGRRDVCVAAVYMCPKQLRISGRVVSFPNAEEMAREPEVAELINGKVVIRPLAARW